MSKQISIVVASFGLLAVLLVLPSAALAQNGSWMVTAGPIAVGPLSGSARQFNIGFGVDLGLTWQFAEQSAIRIDFVQTTLEEKENPQFAASVPVEAKPRMQFGTLNYVFRAPATDKLRLYVTAGVGVYRRSVGLSVTTSAPIDVCNPWWFVCFPGPVSADRVNATRAVTNFGVNLGVGLTFHRFFAETRFHYVWGPTFTTPRGPVKATGRFLPLLVGVRF